MTMYSPLAVFRHMLLRATLVTLAPTLLAAGERQKKAERDRKVAKPPTQKQQSVVPPPASVSLPAVLSDPSGETWEPLTLALLAFEAHISWISVSRTWATRRVRWLRRAKGTATLEDVADLVLTLESAMGWTGMEAGWHRRRDAWLEEVESAESAAKLTELLLELERSTKWTAVTREWKTERSAWLHALGGLRVAVRRG